MATNVPKLKGAKSAGSKSGGTPGVIQQGAGIPQVSHGNQAFLGGIGASGKTTVNSTPKGGAKKG